MNRTLPHRLRQSAPLVVAVATFAAAGTASAQEPQYRGPEFINLDFRGGTASEYVQAPRATSEQANIVVLNGIDLVRLPPITLRRVTMCAAIELLEGRTDNAILPSIELDVEHDPIAEDPRAAEVFTVEARSRARQSRGGIQGPGTKVFAVDHLIQANISAEDVLSAIELALEQVSEAHTNPPDIKFHEPTAILIARGSRDQLQAMEQVLGSIEETVIRRLDRMQGEADAQQWGLEREQLIQELTSVRQHAAGAEESLNAVSRLAKEREVEVDAMRRQLEHMERVIADLQAELRARKSGGER